MKLLKIARILLKLCQSGEISPNLGSLGPNQEIDIEG